MGIAVMNCDSSVIFDRFVKASAGFPVASFLRLLDPQHVGVGDFGEFFLGERLHRLVMVYDRRHAVLETVDAMVLGAVQRVADAQNDMVDRDVGDLFRRAGVGGSPRISGEMAVDAADLVLCIVIIVSI